MLEYFFYNKKIAKFACVFKYNNLSVQPQLTNLLNLILKNLIMRRNCYLLFTVFAFLAFFSYSCVDEDFFSTTHRHEFNDFSLEEAKTYFRERSENQLSRSDGSDENLPLSPGNFVPLWDGAVPSVMNGLACYDIPISETSSYHAIISEEHNGTIIARQVKVYQKLVILKNLNDGMMSQYILSLIPSKSYELQKGKQISELFTTRGDKGGFSGIAIYSCLYTGVTARVDTYNKGRKVNGVFLLDAKNHEELNSKIETAKELLCMLSLQKRKKILSRGESDYGYEIDGGWLDEVIITPEEPWDGTGADGMTNEEWLENTRPDGNVDPQPEPEPELELPEEDYSQAEEEKGSEKDKELNEKIESLNKNDELKNKVKEIFDSFYQKSNCKENGWIRSGGVVHGPKDQGSTSIKYNWSKIEKGITEWYHSHPTGAPIPSVADLSLLTSRYSGGYLDVNNFSYGVISVFGCTTFIITSEENFKAFAESFSYDKMKDDIEEFVSKSGGGAESIVSAFSDFLDTQKSGLELIFNPYDQSTNEWGGWKVP